MLFLRKWLHHGLNSLPQEQHTVQRKLLAAENFDGQEIDECKALVTNLYPDGFSKGQKYSLRRSGPRKVTSWKQGSCITLIHSKNLVWYAHQIWCASTVQTGTPYRVCCAHHFLVCTAHLHWCAQHTILVCYALHYTIMLYSARSFVHVIHNKIHKICSSIYCLSSLHAVTAAIQGYHFRSIPETHIQVLVTTSSQKIILCTLNALSFQSRLCRAYTLYIK